MNRSRQKPPSKPVIRSGATLVELTGVPAERLAASEREAVLDQILTALWKGKLTREAAVDGFLQD